MIEAAFNKKEYSGVLTLVGKLLTSQVHDSYSTISVDWSTPDVEMLHRLTNDVWSFSAAKNWQQMRDLTLALKDENGKLREFDAFKKAVEPICDKYNITWLETEYDTCISSSQSASRWVSYQKDKKTIKKLTFQTVGDAQVRPEHQILDGLILDIDDPRLDRLWTPLGWKCRCEWLQYIGSLKSSNDIPNIHVPEMFSTNFAKQGIVFPKNHPYYTEIPRTEIRKSIAYLPPQNTFSTYQIGKNAKIDIHPLHGDKELVGNIEACKLLMDIEKKADIKLLPIIQVNAKTKTKDLIARKAFYGEKYVKSNPERCPDLIYNGRIAEIETASNTASSIKNRVRDGKLQADFILIHVPDTMRLDDAFRHANGQMNHYKDKEDLTVWIFNKEGKREITTKKRR